MFKLFALCMLAVFACASAKPGILAASPLAYSAYAAPVAYNAGFAPVVAPYASSYTASNVIHSAAYPAAAYAATPFTYNAPLAYSAPAVAAPVAYSAPALAAPLAYSAPVAAPLAYAAPVARAAFPVARAAFPVAPVAPIAAPVVLKK